MLHARGASRATMNPFPRRTTMLHARGASRRRPGRSRARHARVRFRCASSRVRVGPGSLRTRPRSPVPVRPARTYLDPRDRRLTRENVCQRHVLAGYPTISRTRGAPAADAGGRAVRVDRGREPGPCRAIRLCRGPGAVTGPARPAALGDSPAKRWPTSAFIAPAPRLYAVEGRNEPFSLGATVRGSGVVAAAGMGGRGVVRVGLLGRPGARACPNLPQRRPAAGSAARRSAEYQRFSSDAPARSGPLQQIWTTDLPVD